MRLMYTLLLQYDKSKYVDLCVDFFFVCVANANTEGPELSDKNCNNNEMAKNLAIVTHKNAVTRDSIE